MPDGLDDGGRRSFAAWAAGRTGYPIVDAGMRQLRAEGWMHNRVRMIIASFLVKDLHVRLAARRPALPATCSSTATSPQNQHNWQWVAGTGTDAAPYFRVFNPVTQGQKFDPDGAYVRRWVPELRGSSRGRGARAVDARASAPGGLSGPDRRPRRRATTNAGPLRRGPCHHAGDTARHRRAVAAVAFPA